MSSGDPALASEGSARVAPWLVIGATCLVAVALGVFGTSLQPTNLFSLRFAALLLLAVLTWTVDENVVTTVSGGQVGLSFVSIIVLATVALVGPVAAGLVGLIAVGLAPRRQPFRGRVFNMAMYAVMGIVAGLVYRVTGGTTDIDSLEGAGTIAVAIGLPLFAAELAQVLVNAVLLSIITRVAQGVPVRVQLASLVSITGVLHFGYGIVAFLFVVLWGPARVGWFSAVLIIVPLFVARWAFVQFGAERIAHERAMRALVVASELKDPTTVGHADRVSLLVTHIGQAMALSPLELENVRVAAMLHDIGLVVHPNSLPDIGPGHLSPRERSVAAHPRVAMAMLKDISFMAGSLRDIKHHHERWDGNGYPSGLRGADIPVGSRIIAVADAFDALTSGTVPPPGARGASAGSRLSRAAALARLRAGAGTQFDPEVVAACERAVHRHGWPPATQDLPVVVPQRILSVDTGATWHDHPNASDRLGADVDELTLVRRVGSHGTRP